MDCTIGVDFDNTLVNYDDLMYEIARQRGLIPSSTPRIKKDIRDRIRQLPEGEIEWQRLQAVAYGPRISGARLIDGVRNFFELCRDYKTDIYVISHKTEYANYDETNTNLRTAAMAWLEDSGLFAAAGPALSPGKVYFEPTRREKIERIRQLKCTHFIDDLEETFLEESFPIDVEKILYAPYRPSPLRGEVRVFVNWRDINDYFFGREGVICRPRP